MRNKHLEALVKESEDLVRNISDNVELWDNIIEELKEHQSTFMRKILEIMKEDVFMLSMKLLETSYFYKIYKTQQAEIDQDTNKVLLYSDHSLHS